MKCAQNSGKENTIFHSINLTIHPANQTHKHTHSLIDRKAKI